MKKRMCIWLASILLLVLAAVPVTAEARSGRIGDLYWTFEDGADGCFLTFEGTGAIPPVETPWFSDNADPYIVTNIIFGEGVTRIGRGCMPSMHSLTGVEFSSTIEEVGANNFMNCDNLEGIVLPEGLQVLGENCFSGCEKLEWAVLPSTLQTIGDGCLTRCTALVELGVAEENPVFALKDGLLINRQDGKVMAAITGSERTECTVPDTVTAAGDYAFAGWSALEQASLPERFRHISRGMFENCTGLKNVDLPKKLLDIDAGAFAGCSALKEIAIPNHLRSISADAFEKTTAFRCAEGSYADFHARRYGLEAHHTGERLVCAEGSLPDAALLSPTVALKQGSGLQADQCWLKFYELEDRRSTRRIAYDVDLLDRYGKSVSTDAPIQLILPYPEGLGWETAGGYQIKVIHEGKDGTEQFSTAEGSLECLKQGLSLNVTHFSPFEITWSEAVESPEATAAPEPTAAPEATATPELTAAPEATATPELTAAPEATAAPEPTTRPPQTGDGGRPSLYLLLLLGSAAALLLLRKARKA